MRRRTFLHTSGTAILAGCAGTGAATPGPTSPVRGAPATGAGRRLAPVRVSDDRIIRTVVGLRPFRRLGFRVAAQRFDDKTVVHNYGHGGAGVTLSWGTSHLAVELATRSDTQRVAVIGSGVVGLSTALLLQDRGRHVTIYARELPPNTTSNVAGAQWAPYTVVDPEGRTAEFTTSFARAARFSYRRFQDLVGEEYGVYWRSNYIAADNPVRFSWELEQVPDLFPETRDLEAGDHPFPRPHVRHFMTMHIEPARYLRALTRDFLRRGGRIMVQDFADRQQVLALDESLIVNCSGLGARDLFGDDQMLPIKGQLTVLLPQPEVDYILISQGIYMMPRSDGIVLGGTHERGIETLEPNLEAKARIVAGHREFFGSMRADPG